MATLPGGSRGRSPRQGQIDAAITTITRTPGGNKRAGDLLVRTPFWKQKMGTSSTTP